MLTTALAETELQFTKMSLKSPSLDSKALTIKLLSAVSSVEALQLVQSFHLDKVPHGFVVVRKPEIS